MTSEYKNLIIGLWATNVLGEGTLRRLVDAMNTLGLEHDPLSALRLGPQYLEPRFRARAQKVVEKGLEPWFEAARRELEWSGNLQLKLLTRAEVEYPPLLRRGNGPAVIAVRGSVEALHAPQVAIVGTRRRSDQAAAATRLLAGRLAQEGIVVTSGGAYGIDSEAHRGALENGGRTVVVMGTAHNTVYPAAHASLFNQAAENGAVVSQFPLTLDRIKGQFPKRNAVIAGLSQATVVAQAPDKSGALHTATAARRAGRPVYIMPGPPLQPGFEGGYQLVETGDARVLRSIDELLNPCVGPEPPKQRKEGGRKRTSGGKTGSRGAAGADKQGALIVWQAKEPKLSGLAARIWEELKEGPVSRDRLLMLDQEIDAVLLELELQGHIEQAGGARYQRASRYGGVDP